MRLNPEDALPNWLRVNGSVCSIDRPPRISIIEGDAGYAAYVSLGGHATKFKAYQHGKLVDGVVTIDFVGGFAVVYYKDKSGQHRILNGDLVTHTVLGPFVCYGYDQETGEQVCRFE